MLCGRGHDLAALIAKSIGRYGPAFDDGNRRRLHQPHTARM